MVDTTAALVETTDVITALRKAETVIMNSPRTLWSLSTLNTLQKGQVQTFPHQCCSSSAPFCHQARQCHKPTPKKHYFYMRTTNKPDIKTDRATAQQTVWVFAFWTLPWWTHHIFYWASGMASLLLFHSAVQKGSCLPGFYPIKKSWRSCLVLATVLTHIHKTMMIELTLIILTNHMNQTQCYIFPVGWT